MPDMKKPEQPCVQPFKDYLHPSDVLFLALTTVNPVRRSLTRTLSAGVGSDLAPALPEGTGRLSSSGSSGFSAYSSM